MNIQEFREQKVRHATTITMVKEFSSHLSKNLNFLSSEEMTIIKRMRAKKQDIYWILTFLELASSLTWKQHLQIFLMKCPNLKPPESWLVETARELQPQVPLCLVSLMIERSVEVNQPYWRTPPTTDRFMESIKDELEEIRQLAGILQGSEVVFQMAEKRWSERHG